MTWSYSGDPGASDLDQVRFLIGDTDTTDQQLSNEELEYLLNKHGSVAAAATNAVHALIAKYTRLADQRTGDISINYSQRLKHYRDLLARLSSSTFRPVAPYAGGISQSDEETVEADTDRDAPVFKIGQMDNT